MPFIELRFLLCTYMHSRHLACCQRAEQHCQHRLGHSDAALHACSKQQVNLQWDQLGFGLNHVAPVGPCRIR